VRSFADLLCYLTLIEFLFKALVNVFKVRQGKETHVYKTETASEKKNLLAQFKVVADELYAKRRREREGEFERRKTVFNNSDVRSTFLHTQSC
jgi:hypothetical protein